MKFEINLRKLPKNTTIIAHNDNLLIFVSLISRHFYAKNKIFYQRITVKLTLGEGKVQKREKFYGQKNIYCQNSFWHFIVILARERETGFCLLIWLKFKYSQNYLVRTYLVRTFISFPENYLVRTLTNSENFVENCLLFNDFSSQKVI